MSFYDLQRQVAALKEAADALHALVEKIAADRDPFTALIHQTRREYRNLNRRRYKGGRDHQSLIEGTYFRATQMGYRGSIQDWKAILWPGT